MEYPKEIYVRVEDESTDTPYLIAQDGMPDDEGPVAVYRLVAVGDVVVTREVKFEGGTAIVQ